MVVLCNISDSEQMFLINILVSQSRVLKTFHIFVMLNSVKFLLKFIVVIVMEFQYGTGESTSKEHNENSDAVSEGPTVGPVKMSLPRVYLGIRIGIR